MSEVIRMRVERLGDELARTRTKLSDLLALAEEEKRPLNEFEQEQATKYRTQIAEFENEIEVLAVDIESENASRDVSALLRTDEEPRQFQEVKRFAQPKSHMGAYSHYTDYIRDWAIVNIPNAASEIGGGDGSVARMEAQERIERTLQNTTSTSVAGLIVPTHMTQIMDVISTSRPVVESAMDVPLDRGSMTYPKVDTRPTVVEQTSEKTEGGTVAPAISQQTLAAKTYLGAGNISWQAANWSSPDAIAVWFRLAAEAYARQTENRACDVLEDAAIGTVGTASGRLGTAGTESFGQWRTAVATAVGTIISNGGGRYAPDTLYLGYDRFIELATLGTDQVAQMSPIGSVDFTTLSGNFFGLRVIGSYGFDQDVAILGLRRYLMVGENPGSPVELRVVEPSIAGYEIGVVGAFNAAVFDTNAFQHLGTHL
jgi:HK97 family phage major capsid protein